jgi:hypothetical protein
MKEQRAYHRNDNGTLDIITILIEDDGTVCDPWGLPMNRTDETVELKGWPDSVTRIYLNAGGREVLVPEA